MQTIVVDREGLIDEKFASIIGCDGESVHTSALDEQGSCPTHSKVITSAEPWPSAFRRTIRYRHHCAHQVGLSSIQVLAVSALLEVENSLSETSFH
jgi:hypothetical protein